MTRLPVALLFAALLAPPVVAQSVQVPGGLAPFHPDVARASGKDVKAPTPLARSAPKYTPETLRAKIEGSVVLEVLVDASGEISDARVVQPLEPTLDANAVAAARAWKFLPGVKNGEAVPVVVTLVMEFRLH